MVGMNEGLCFDLCCRGDMAYSFCNPRSVKSDRPGECSPKKNCLL